MLAVGREGYFYPRSPCGERPHCHQQSAYCIYFYPRSPCGERPWQRGSRVTYVEFLSTLSLRRATVKLFRQNYECFISIHALLAESDCPLFFSCWLLAYFYPRSPCGERLIRYLINAKYTNFYPRSPCGERLSTTIITICTVLFLSTLSLRRATTKCDTTD